MTAESLWQLFLKTGLPECYALYRLAKQAQGVANANQAAKPA